jgi:hypothetical protein
MKASITIKAEDGSITVFSADYCNMKVTEQSGHVAREVIVSCGEVKDLLVYQGRDDKE